MAITTDEIVLSGQLRISRTRIGGVHLYETVIRGEALVSAAADTLDSPSAKFTKYSRTTPITWRLQPNTESHKKALDELED